jgi:hypothetical protein
LVVDIRGPAARYAALPPITTAPRMASAVLLRKTERSLFMTEETSWLVSNYTGNRRLRAGVMGRATFADLVDPLTRVLDSYGVLADEKRLAILRLLVLADLRSGEISAATCRTSCGMS